MKLHNLTLHYQSVLSSFHWKHYGITEVEIEPRLKVLPDVTDYNNLKDVVRQAVADIPPGSAVLVGGLGQYQALIMQLNFRFFFVDFDTVNRVPKDLIEHQPFTRSELLQIEERAYKKRE